MIMKASLIPALLTAILAGSIPALCLAEGVVLQWEKIYNGPGTGVDTPLRPVVDSAGNVIITGSSVGSSGNLDFYTAKYAAGDGTLLWERRYNGPGTLGDTPSALVVDSAGNVIVTGGSSGSSNRWLDFYTAKYAATNEALLWEKRYNGTADGTDSARAVALDSAGNVIVTGTVSTGSNYYNTDCYTAKYASEDGALLWEMRYKGTGNTYNLGRGVVVDEGDKVIVTGRTNYTSITTSDFYTAKYAPVDLDLDDDGLLDSWEITHFGNTAAHGALDDTDGDGAVE